MASGDRDDAAAQASVERLRALIRIPTVSRTAPETADETQFEAFRTLLASLYPLTHDRLELEVVGGGSLLFRWPGRGPGAPSVLMAHYDVVPADEPGWTHDAFGAELVGDGDEQRVWGRGAIDDKGMLCAILEAVDDALAAGKIPALDIYFQGTAEWIPWELLHDGKGYLGLRFAVARHPIVQERMDLGVPRNRPVKKVCSYLGKEVLQDGVLDGWKGTFAGFSATAGWEKRFPPADGAEFPSLDQLDQALDAELIHVTCHGGKKDENCDDSPDVHAMPPETEEHNAAGAFTPNASADKLARMGKEKIVVYEKPT